MSFLRACVLVFLAVCVLKSSLATIFKPRKAQQLLEYNFKTEQFVLDSRCLVEISKLRGPIIVVSAVGDARIGKSTTLNLIRHFWNENSLLAFDETFETGNTTTPVTHGVWASIIPAKTPDESNAILLDVEGLNVADDAVTAHLSMFTALVSSAVHIFTRDMMQNHVLEFLYFILRLTEMIFPDERFDNFPHLGIMVRGALETPPGYTLDEYIHDSILSFANNDRMQEERKKIGKYFSKDKISSNQIPYVQNTTIFKDKRKFRDTDFHNVILSLVEQFKKSPQKKSLNGDRLMDGESLALFVKKLFLAMNKNAWMDFNDAYLMLERQICADAYGKIVRPVLDKTASESADLENTMAEFKTKCALPEEVETAKKDLLAARQRAVEIKEMKERAYKQEMLLKKTETETKIAHDKFQKDLKEKDEKLSEEVERTEQLQMRNKRLEDEIKSQQIQSQLQLQRAQASAGGSSIERFLGTVFGTVLGNALFGGPVGPLSVGLQCSADLPRLSNEE